jgi:1,4-dihydroxy-2-naphthoate octaprenyltransferase
MSARHKLNRAFVNGSLLLAGVAGALTGSWLVFGLALAALVTANLYTGDIRPDKRR